MSEDRRWLRDLHKRLDAGKCPVEEAAARREVKRRLEQLARRANSRGLADEATRALRRLRLD